MSCNCCVDRRSLFLYNADAMEVEQMPLLDEADSDNEIPPKFWCKFFNKCKKDHGNANEVSGVVDVCLRRNPCTSFGIGLSGGTDQLYPPHITFLRPGSAAHLSDQLRVGERLKLVNGIAIDTLTHGELMTLVRNSGEYVYLQLEYSLDHKDFKQPSNTRLASAEIVLIKENNRIGVTLRGGAYGPDRRKSRPITIMNIRTGSPAHREKRLKVGDRVLGINGADVFNATLAAAQKLLYEAVNTVVLTVEYCINIIDAAYRNSDHICVEIEKGFSLDVGIEMICEIDHTNNSAAHAFYIDRLIPASAADRCGALSPGDQIIAINGCKLDVTTFSEVKRLLQTHLPSLYLEIIPAHQIRRKQRLKESFLPLTEICIMNGQLYTASDDQPGDVRHQRRSTISNSAPSTGILQHSYAAAAHCFNTSLSKSNNNKMSLLRRSFHKRSSSKPKVPKTEQPVKHDQVPKSTVPSRTASVGGVMSRVPCRRICHQETMEVTLHSYARGSFGLLVHEQMISRPSAGSHAKRQPVFISYIEKNSPAERSGVLQVGDRILAINTWNSINGTAEEANQILRQSTSPLTLTVEFDVIESALPLEGVFNVKLAKRGNNLGIVVRSETENTKGEPVIISEVRVGSVAYRCGSLHSGDRILAVDNILLDSCTVEEAMRLLQRSGEIVKLRVRKGSTSEQDNQDAVQSLIYSIELSRKGGPLGITIASTGERYEPVLISHLAPGGLAEKTGALRVGDRILAVNNEPVEGMKAADVMHLLQQSADLVTIKIMRIFDSSASNSGGLWHVPNSSQAEKIRLQHSAAMSDSYSETSEKIGTPIQSIDSAVESLDDSPGNIPKYQSGAQRYVIDEQVPNTSLNYDLNSRLEVAAEEANDYEKVPHPCSGAHSSGLSGSQNMDPRRKSGGSYWVEQIPWDSGLSSATDNALPERCNCHKNAETNQQNWVKVLEALETVGEAEMLRKLEECTTGSGGGGTSATTAYPQGSPLITSHHDAAIAQRTDLRLPYCGGAVVRQPYPSFSSSTGNTLVRASLSPSVKPKFSQIRSQKSQYSSIDRMDSLSLSNDSQTSTSLGDIPYHMGPPKPPRYTPVEQITQQTLPVLSEPLNTYSPGYLSACSIHESSGSKGAKLSSPPPTALVLHELSSKTFAPATSGTTHRVRLRKDPRTNSFGFSVSDGVGDNAGVLINAILPGGPADRCGQIFPYDKILQINDTSLQYLDCDLALPLLCVDEIEMVLYREVTPPKSTRDDDDDEAESYRSIVNLSLRDSAV